MVLRSILVHHLLPLLVEIVSLPHLNLMNDGELTDREEKIFTRTIVLAPKSVAVTSKEYPRRRMPEELPGFGAIRRRHHMVSPYSGGIDDEFSRFLCFRNSESLTQKSIQVILVHLKGNSPWDFRIFKLVFAKSQKSRIAVSKIGAIPCLLENHTSNYKSKGLNFCSFKLFKHIRLSSAYWYSREW